MEDTNADDDRWALPAVVAPDEWQQARDALLVKGKRATRAFDVLAAERRRMAVVELSAGHEVPR